MNNETSKQMNEELNISQIASTIVTFISGALNESDLNTEAMMRKDILNFVGTLNTKEDLERFIETNKAQMENIQRTSAGSKAKQILCKIWDVLCKVVKSVNFVIGNIKNIAILAMVIYACITFKVGPIELLKLGWDTACVIVQAAKITVDGAKKTADAYSTYADTTSSWGEKVGSKIGTIWAGAEDIWSKMTRPTPKKRTYESVNFKNLYYGWNRFLDESLEV